MEKEFFGDGFEKRAILHFDYIHLIGLVLIDSEFAFQISVVNTGFFLVGVNIANVSFEIKLGIENIIERIRIAANFVVDSRRNLDVADFTTKNGSFV